MIATKVLSSFLVSECAYFRTQFREFVLSRLWKGDGKARCMLWNTVNMECLKMRDPETDTFSGFLFRYTFPEKIRVFFLICQISELNCWQIDLLLKKNSDESVKLSGVKLVAPEHSDVFPNAFFLFLDGTCLILQELDLDIHTQMRTDVVHFFSGRDSLPCSLQALSGAWFGTAG